MSDLPTPYYDDPPPQPSEVDLTTVKSDERPLPDGLAYKPVTCLSDNDKMPFGKHKGLCMKDVPVGWLHWFYTKCMPNHLNGTLVHDYIVRNLNALRKENNDLIWTPRKLY